MAAKRGITVSELVRHYIEEGLSNPTPREIRRLSDRLSTMERAILELYEMAIVNWAQVEKEPKKTSPKIFLPWQPEFLEQWKATLDAKGMLSERTGMTAYEEMKAAREREDSEGARGWEDEPDEDIQAYLREMWIADGSWTEAEEKKFQEKRKRVPKYTRAKKKTTSRRTTKRKPAAKSDSTAKPASQKSRNRRVKGTPKGQDGGSKTRKP
nr:hypothetical protein [Nitrosomonas nitrosa]